MQAVSLETLKEISSHPGECAGLAADFDMVASAKTNRRSPNRRGLRL